MLPPCLIDLMFTGFWANEKLLRKTGGTFGFYVNPVISYKQEDVPLSIKSEMKR